MDAVAGPVGEALIMTAIGLGVAIPAVLAYNVFNARQNRVTLRRSSTSSRTTCTISSRPVRESKAASRRLPRGK
jgi:biopolymer transport protein ExbB